MQHLHWKESEPNLPTSTTHVDAVHFLRSFSLFCLDLALRFLILEATLSAHSAQLDILIDRFLYQRYFVLDGRLEMI